MFICISFFNCHGLADDCCKLVALFMGKAGNEILCLCCTYHYQSEICSHENLQTFLVLALDLVGVSHLDLVQVDNICTCNLTGGLEIKTTGCLFSPHCVISKF